MTDKEKAGRPFERLVAAVQKKLDPGSKVHSPYRVTGKSGLRIELDGAVIGTIGSATMFVAIEAKDYTERVGVEKVRAFVTTIQDAGANRGIMVAPLGFTEGTLLTAAQYGIDTCVLRPGTDEDWEGINRSLKATITMLSNLYYDAEVELADGRVIKVNEGGMHLLTDETGKTVFFDHLINYALSLHPDLREKHIALKPTNPLWEEDDDGGRVAVVALRCRRALVPGFTQTFLHTAPEDYVFVKLTPDGAVDERHFFQFAELERIAEQFKKHAT